MREFETLVGLLLAAVILAAVARKVGAPYPAFLALGGAVLAFVPGAPALTIEPDLALALFVAPVLLDAAYDASPRDLRDNWVPVASLVVVSVGLDHDRRRVGGRARSCRTCRGRRRSRSAPSCRRPMRPPRRRCCGSSGRRIAF